MGKKPLLSPEREAELRSVFPHHADAALAQRFGLTVRQVQNLGSKAGLRKTAETRSESRNNRPRGGVPILNQVLQILEAMGEAGTTRTAVEVRLCHLSPSGVSSALNKLTATDRAVRIGTRSNSRWFATQAYAQAFRLAVAQKARPAPAPPARPAVHHPKPQVEPVITAATRFTQCPGVPGPEARWHANAQPVFSGPGSIGRYGDEASTWVAAITSRAAAGGAR